MAISNIGGASSSSSAVAPTSPAGYSVFDGGTISTGRYTLPGLSRGGYAFATGESTQIWLRDKTNGKYYNPNQGYSSGQWTSFTLSNSATCDVLTPIYQTISVAAGVTGSVFIYKAGTVLFTRGTDSLLYRSTDGTTWASVSGPTNVISMAYNGSNLYVAISATAIWTSADGVSWTSRAVPSSPGTMTTAYQVVYGNGVFVLNGKYSTTWEIWSSTDGITWTGRTGQTSYTWDTLSHNGQTGASSMFIATAYSFLFYSTDGATWNSGTSPATAYLQISYSATGNVWVATTGTSVSNYYTSPATSTPTWTARTLSLGTPFVIGGNTAPGTLQPVGHIIANGTVYISYYPGTWGQPYQVLFPITDPTQPATVQKLAGIPSSVFATNGGTNCMFATDASNNVYWLDNNGILNKTNSTFTSGNIFGRFQLYSDTYRTLN